jgi:ribonucleoside-diphosphate reductase beta chain
MVGLNAEILNQYMKWLTNNRLKSIRLEPIFDKVTNPINWITNWTESKSIQEAPQETEKETYVVGSFKQLEENESFDEFSL